MLGISLFNFGAVWNKQRGGQAPWRAKNMRKHKTEQQDDESTEVANLAEREAQAVMLSEQAKERESQQQLQEEAVTVFQKFVRYAAISVWAVSATVIFSSAIFNYPFALGKGMLSLLPGVPHVASISLVSQQEYYKVGDRVEVNAFLDTNQEKVGLVRLVLKYDPTVLEFSDYEVSEHLFDSLEERNINKYTGEIVLSFRNTIDGAVFNKQKVGSFYFDPIVTARCEINVVQEDSAVVLYESSQNILGKTSSANLMVIN